MYIENEVPVDSPLTLISVEMPVDVLVAFSEYTTADPAAPRFNLVEALATLLGRFGWENAAWDHPAAVLGARLVAGRARAVRPHAEARR